MEGLQGSIGRRDVIGGMLTVFFVLFLTAAAWAAPAVTGYQPTAGARVAVGTTVQATFNEPLDPASITPANFSLFRVGLPIIAAGRDHTVVLNKNCTAVAWGANGSGQISIPANLSLITAIAAGNAHSAALKSDGTIAVWGDNASGQTTIPAGLSGITAIAAGGTHTVVLKNDRTVVVWGGNGHGQSSVPSNLAEVIAIAAGGAHTAALKNDGTVTSWGDNGYGQSMVPANLSGVIAIAAGDRHTVALRKDGTAVAWGDNGSGQCTVPANLSGVVAVAAGDSHTIALLNDGTVVAWGRNDSGEATVPAGLRGVIAVAAAGAHSVALLHDGSVVAWGANDSGQNTIPAQLVAYRPRIAGTLGYYQATGTVTFTPSAPLDGGAAYYAALTGVRNQSGVPLPAPGGWGFTVDIPTLSVTTFPSNGANAPINSTVRATFNQPVDPASVTAANFSVSRFVGAKAIAGGGELDIALKRDGTVVTWPNPNTAPPGLSDVKAIAEGWSYSAALKNDGTVVAWGWLLNYDGQRTSQVTVPAGLSGVTAIAAGAGHTVALKNDGTLVAWGDNSKGQCSVPASLSRVTAIAAGWAHTVALQSDGTVVAWGNNDHGQTTVPANLSGVVAIAAGDSLSIALKDDGTVVAWGTNYTEQSSPPAGLSGVTAIAAGNYHVLALRVDGTLVGWGGNNQGQLSIPAGLSDISAIAASAYGSVVLKKDGTVVAWSDNHSTIPAGIDTVAPPLDGSLSYDPATLTATFTPALPVQSGVPYYAALAGIRNPTGVSLGTPIYWGYTELDVAMSVAPSAHDFGICAIGPNPSTKEFVLSNTGSTNMVLSAITLNGDDAGLFTVTPGTCQSLTPTIAAGGSCTVLVAFKPTSVKSCNATLNIASNASVNGFMHIALTGVGAVPLTVTSYSPAAGTSAPANTTVQASFSDPLDPLYLTTDSFSVSRFVGSKAIAAGGAHSVVLQNDGVVAAWGNNSNGQSTIPTGLAEVTAVAAGNRHTVVLKKDGTVAAWGKNDYYQSTVPQGLAGITAVSAGYEHSVALRSNGTIVSWGNGIATGGSWLSGVTAISAGGYHTLALTSDGTVSAWGFNDAGQTSVPWGINGAKAIAAGLWHSVALRTDGTVVAWGNGAAGQTAVPAGLSGVVAIAAGYSHTLALKQDGTVVAWGSSTVPAGLSGVIAIAAGGSHSLALKNDGTVVAWGDNGSGQISVPELLHTKEPPVSGAFTCDPASRTAIFTPSSLLADGSLYYATLNGLRSQNGAPLATPFQWSFKIGDVRLSVTPSSYDFGNIVLNTTPETRPFTIVNTGAKALVVSAIALNGNNANQFKVQPGSCPSLAPNIASGSSCTVNVTFNPTAVGIQNASLQIVSNSAISPTVSVQLAGSGIATGTPFVVTNYLPPDNAASIPVTTTVQATFSAPINLATFTANSFVLSRGLGTKAIAAGAYHTVVLKSDGTVTAWGYNFFGQTNVPGGLTGVTAIAAGAFHNLALKNDGTVVAWGYNDKGQLAVPAGLSGVKAIAAAGSCSVALKNDGTVVAWGDNDYGQAAVPAGLTGVTAITAGGRHTVALKNDGTVVSWGNNGTGSTGTVPVGLTGVTAIAAGSQHTLALKADGTVVVWGAGYNPVPPGLTGVVAIAAGSYHSVALKNDGTVVSWGQDGYGQTSGLPAGLTGVAAIAAGGYHTVALKNDGTVVAWGYNEQGQTTVPAGFSSSASAVSGAVTYDAASLTTTFTPSAPLFYGVSYYATVSGVRSQAGMPLAAPVLWSFTTFDIAAIPNGMVGIGYSQTLVATGIHEPYTWAITSGSLPTGLSLDGATGLITGTPTAKGTYTFTVQAIGANTPINAKTLTIGIYDAWEIGTATLPLAVTGVAYNQYVSTTGGLAPYTWSITAGALPAGLSLYASAGMISGVPTTTGNFSFTIKATDAHSTSASRSVSIAVYAPLTVTSYLPANHAIAPRNTSVQATFSEQLNPATVTTGNFTLSFGTPKAIAAGGYHSVALKYDGTVVAWGDNSAGQSSVPAGLTGVAAIAAGDFHTVAMKNDGTVVAWGYNYYGQTTVPAGLTRVAAIAAGWDHTVALKTDGTVVAWGYNAAGQTVVPAGLTGVAAIAAGCMHTVALKNDGTVVAWGYNNYGQTTVPVGLTGVISIAAGGYHTVALKSDGTVVAWGNNGSGQTAVPLGLTGVKAIAAGVDHTVALKTDGTVVVWGSKDYGCTSIPEGLTAVTAIASGGEHVVALNDGKVVAWGWGFEGQTNVPEGLGPINAVTGTLSYDPASLSAIFTPSTQLVGGVTYYATLAGVTTQAGVPLTAPVVWNFTASSVIDLAPPLSSIVRPSANAVLGGTTITISGTAADGSGSGVQKVEVSTDGGTSWHTASGAKIWSYIWTPAANSQYTLKSRATDLSGNREIPTAGVPVTTVSWTSIIPIRIARLPDLSFDSFKAIYSSVLEDDIVQSQALSFYEDITFNRDVKVHLKGGYDGTFSSTNLRTTINGVIRVCNGTVKMENLRLR